MLDPELEIRKSRDKVNLLRIGKFIGSGEIRFGDVADLVLRDEYLQQRASQALIYSVDDHQYQLKEEDMQKLVALLLTNGLLEGAYRNLLKTIDVGGYYPESCAGELIDYCFKAIQDMQRAVAIRAFAIPIAFKLCAQYPDLLPELREVLQLIPSEDGVSVIARRDRYLKKIDRFLSK